MLGLRRYRDSRVQRIGVLKRILSKALLPLGSAHEKAHACYVICGTGHSVPNLQVMQWQLSVRV